MNADSVFLDSNICLYLISDDSLKKQKSEQLLALSETVISSQVINEIINVSIKKFKLSESKILAHIDFLFRSCKVMSVSASMQKVAVNLHFRHQLSYYDALIVSSALEAGCTTLFSEDLHHGLMINKLSVINPFK